MKFRSFLIFSLLVVASIASAMEQEPGANLVPPAVAVSSADMTSSTGSVIANASPSTQSSLSSSSDGNVAAIKPSTPVPPLPVPPISIPSAVVSATVPSVDANYVTTDSEPPAPPTGSAQSSGSTVSSIVFSSTDSSNGTASSASDLPDDINFENLQDGMTAPLNSSASSAAASSSRFTPPVNEAEAAAALPIVVVHHEDTGSAVSPTAATSSGGGMVSVPLTSDSSNGATATPANFTLGEQVRQLPLFDPTSSDSGDAPGLSPAATAAVVEQPDGTANTTSSPSAAAAAAAASDIPAPTAHRGEQTGPIDAREWKELDKINGGSAAAAAANADERRRLPNPVLFSPPTSNEQASGALPIPVIVDTVVKPRGLFHSMREHWVWTTIIAVTAATGLTLGGIKLYQVLTEKPAQNKHRRIRRAQPEPSAVVKS